jgi:hypothetical protein
MIAGLIILASVGLWVFGFAVGRNNPSLPAVNNLIAKGKAIIDAATGKVIKK